MSVRIATHSVRDLRDALDAAEHDLANGVPGARFAVNYNRRELESMAYNLASDLLDAHAALATERERADKLAQAARQLEQARCAMYVERRLDENCGCSRCDDLRAILGEIRGAAIAGCP